VGAHFPADVVGGILIGMGAAGLAMLLVRALSARN
jgi:membrane-associated phospholipid phosphatase